MSEQERIDHRALLSEFDRKLGDLDGLNDVLKTAQSVVRDVPTLGIGGTATYIVQTCRQRDRGDFIFFEHVVEGRATRLVIPPRVADVIARQRDQLTDKSRSAAAKANAQERKARGWKPSFKKRSK